MLADAMKINVENGKENNDFTSGVKVEVHHLKDDQWAKVLFKVLQANDNAIA